MQVRIHDPLKKGVSKDFSIPENLQDDHLLENYHAEDLTANEGS